MNKTPQQIRNEVEKEIEKLKKTQPDVTIGLNGLHWIEKDKIKIMKLEAQLSILTEYDKSIKEMIEKHINNINPQTKDNLNILKNRIQHNYTNNKNAEIDRERSIINPEVRKRDNNKCCFCGKDVFEVSKIIGGGNTIHHLVPKRYSGKQELNNLITICGYCHQRLEVYLNIIEKKAIEFTLNFCIKDLKGIFQKELLSKIGDGSEVEK
ncbi:MAG: HNH endonuclease [archaeon]|jgi:hypothetical protein